jgi:hypothetical protein
LFQRVTNSVLDLFQDGSQAKEAALVVHCLTQLAPLGARPQATG